MRTSKLNSMSLSQLYRLRKNTWEKISKTKDADKLHQHQVNMAYIQKVLQDREE